MSGKASEDLNTLHHSNLSSGPSNLQALLEKLAAGAVGRRDFLRDCVRYGLASIAAYKLLSATTASAQDNGQFTSQAIGEESGGFGQPPQQEFRQPTFNPTPSNSVTSYAIGEESQTGIDRTPPRTATTFAVGEESTSTQPQARYPRHSSPSSFVRGEEGQPITTWAVGEETLRVTSYAIGEETIAPPNTLNPDRTQNSVPAPSSPPSGTGPQQKRARSTSAWQSLGKRRYK